jgi:tubulin beta
MAPLTRPGGAMYEKVGIPELTSEIFNPSSFLAACNPSLGKYLTTAVYYRGKGLSSRAAEEALFAIRTKNPSYFADWIPNSSTMSLCAVPPLASTHSATFVANHTAVQELFTRTHAQFSAMLRRKAFLHWYTGEGMDEMEFTEAESNILDLIQEYQQYESTETEEEDDETVLVKHEEEE